jgi:hypothetical protein
MSAKTKKAFKESSRPMIAPLKCSAGSGSTRKAPRQAGLKLRKRPKNRTYLSGPMRRSF